MTDGRRDSTAKVWDAESGKELLTLRGHSGKGFASGSRITRRKGSFKTSQ
jgi:WD40 repeat protein